MCRIAGIIHQHLDAHQLKLQIKTMCASQAHGGPDGEGTFIDEDASLALGHRRLSLLDLTAAGHQPMHFKHNSISFNGEVYNFEEIKQELKGLGHHFHTHSDTEIILHAYAQWGKECFQRFNGMFAIAIYDQKAQEVILARDISGIKPLYYLNDGQKFIFASEVKAFLSIYPHLEEDPNWKIYFLSFGFVPEPFTTLKQVKQLQPGYYLSYSIKSKQVKEQQFDELNFSSFYQNPKEINEIIRKELSLAVKRHLISDAPIGVFLSGGIDSSIITLLAAQNNSRPIQTLSVSFSENNYDESAFQKIIHQKVGSQHTHYAITQEDYLEAIPELKSAFDQPSNDAINSWFIARCAKQNGLKAVLSGIGGDELFGGYPSFKRIDTAFRLRHLPLQLFNIADHISNDRFKKLSFLKEERTYADYLFLRGFYTPNTISKLLDATEEEIKNALHDLNYHSPRKTIHPKNYVSWLEQNIYMRSQLLKDTDYMSMQHGIEVRVPFLDKDFLKIVHQIDPKIKFSGKIPKNLLIQAFKDILPEPIWKRKKMGFTFPFQEWNKHHPEITKITQHNNKQVSILGKQFLNNKLHWSRCFALLQIEKYLPLKDALFLTLKTFSHTGGIEKVNRILMKAGTDIQSEHLIRFHAKSLHDDLPDEKYITSRRFKGFNGNLYNFIYKSVSEGIKCDVVMFSHINLAIVGLLIKWLNPRTKLLIQAHGIDVWGDLSFIKKLFLKKADAILAVSKFTQDILIQKHHINPAHCLVFHNSLDPYFDTEAHEDYVNAIKNKLGLNFNDNILVTLTRLASSEKYKGYDKVLQALAILKNRGKLYKYLILGKYDDGEKQRIDALIKELQLEDLVYITGFVEDKMISSYFMLADVFIMPSQKEGFGIVFIEAMACGIPVIAGNADGSVDALNNGELGTLVNPASVEEIISAIESYKQHPLSFDIQLLKNKVQENFGYPIYKERLKQLLLN